MTTIVLLPGLDGTGIMFKPLVNELKNDFRLQVLAYPQDPKYGYKELTELVRAKLPGEDFFLLGESFSGPIAIRLASEKPTGLRGLVLCATFATNPSPLFPALLAFVIVSPLFAVWPVSVKLSVLAGSKPSDEIRRMMSEIRQATSGSVLAARTREAVRVNVTKELKQCSSPILYLSGERDMVVPKRNRDYILSAKPDTRIETLSTSHLVLQEDPRQSASAIRAFVKQTT